MSSNKSIYDVLYYLAITAFFLALVGGLAVLWSMYDSGLSFFELWNLNTHEIDSVSIAKSWMIFILGVFGSSCMLAIGIVLTLTLLFFLKNK